MGNILKYVNKAYSDWKVDIYSDNKGGRCSRNYIDKNNNSPKMVEPSSEKSNEFESENSSETRIK